MAWKKKHPLRKCIECQYAHLVEYTGDPLIRECERDGDKNVASIELVCKYFKRRIGEPDIEKRKKKIGITDIYI